MAPVNDIYSRQVLFNDGEGLEFADLNSAQQLHNRMLFDNLLMSMIPNVAADAPGSPTTATSYWAASKEWANTLVNSYGKDLVFVHDAGQAYWRPKPTANNTLQLVPGTVMLPIGDPSNGGSPSTISDFVMVPFRLGDYSLSTELVCAVGDSTFPRIDLVEIQVAWEDGDMASVDFEDATTRAPSSDSFNKRRRAVCTVQVKTGTPAAIPAYPTPSSGFRAMAAVLVPATYNAAFDTVTQFRDLRWPLGRVGVYDVPAQYMLQAGGGTAWARSGYGMNAPTGATNVWLPCPVTDPTARLLGVGLVGNDNASATSSTRIANFSLQPNDVSASSQGDIAQPDGQLFSRASGGAFQQLNALDLMDQASGVAGSIGHGSGVYVGDRASGTYVGTPVWLNGYASGVARAPTNNEHYGIAVHVLPALNALLGKVRFVVAHGLG